MDVAAGCNGSVAGELGGAAVAPSGWKLVCNAHQAPVDDGPVVVQHVDDEPGHRVRQRSPPTRPLSGAVVWLTTTAGVNEADSAIARWQPEGDATEQYVVGWLEPTTVLQARRASAPTGNVHRGPDRRRGARRAGASATIRSASTPTATSCGRGSTPPARPRCTSPACAPAAARSARRSSDVLATSRRCA